MILISVIFALIMILKGTHSNQQEEKFVNFNIPTNNGLRSKLKPNKRITGGIEILKEDFYNFNYQVGMYIIKDSDGYYKTSLCGGSLVHPQFVLTAGHCVYLCKYVSMFMGTHIKPYSEYDPGNIKIGEENIIIHEDYDDYTLDDDIAIIHLPNEVELSPNVGIIPIASYEWADCESGIAYVSGWGKTDDSDYSIPDVMNYLTVEPITYDQCYEFYDFLQPKKQLCSSGDLYKGICQGDSGGPYAFENEYGQRYLCGVNSFVANSGCINNLPKGYASVAYYNDNGWLCKNSKGLVGCSKFNYADL